MRWSGGMIEYILMSIAIDLTKIRIEKETIDCDLCGSRPSRHRDIVVRDAFGFEVKTVICTRCGNIFLNPRPSKNWYKWFYNNLYDDVVGHQINSPQWREQFFENDLKYGRATYGMLKGSLPSVGRMLDVGCSMGALSLAFEENGWDAWGVDPAQHHIDFAKEHAKGKFFAIPIEDFTADVKFDLIIYSRSLNHILSPSGFFRRAACLLKDKGQLFIRVLDTRLQLLKPRLSTQIDHPTVFSRQSLYNYLSYWGFGIIKSGRTGDYWDILASHQSGAGRRIKNNYFLVRSIILRNTASFCLGHLLHKASMLKRQ